MAQGTARVVDKEAKRGKPKNTGTNMSIAGPMHACTCFARKY